MKIASRLAPLVIVLVLWELATGTDARRAFFFGSPTLVAAELWEGFSSGEMLVHSAVTGVEALSGFLIGNLVGASIGLALWHSPILFQVLRPYILALGTAPLFALAPLIIIWFGTGFTAKLAVATLSTLFVALMQAYKGAEETDPRLIELVRSLGGTKLDVFRKVIVPGSLSWVVAAFRLNVGLALLGAFLAEYISSERGLGHVILVAGGLYNIPLVLAAVICMVALGWILTWLVSVVERPLQALVVRFL